jgi:hypothetical protein
MPTVEELEEFSKEITLALFKVGCEEKNFRILQMLPTTIKEVMVQLPLTKMPANNRVNDLVRAGLARRTKGTGAVEPTDLTKRFLELILAITKDVEREIPRFLELRA